MKAIKLWFGHDSYGRGVEVAQREDGQYFARTCGRRLTTKWSPYTPTFETTTTNVYSGEVTHHPEAPIMYWGFNRLTECKADKINVRLPK